jgi:hypothetical protein
MVDEERELPKEHSAYAGETKVAPAIVSTRTEMTVRAMSLNL